MKRGIVLVSGGLDSCVTAAIAKNMGYSLYFLHINYGQKTEKKELESFYKLADFFKVVGKLIVDISYLKVIGGSSLTVDSMEIERGDLFRKDIPNTYVPFRNGNILSIAVSWAEVIRADRIFIGVVEEDSSGYPDCRKQFYDAFNQILKVGLAYTDLLIETPLIDKTKGEIVRIGAKLGAPFELTWSCYGENELACGVCDSCLLRLKGFKEAGMVDPIPYRK
ncbi:7-cyano-7-deazaguanine synthase [Calditerrivibrio sp.]|uniref:7-cyano-7-deazaguanine synthase n=1 Tax=Calditerrivibrio nitroreducens TaxID=477976 RepID=A0A2J6WK12_9BACT|nr:MAG: 7-cyano-7-deazaguanine synthase QueC [Calditerrivibrio nitroreducens]